MRGTPDKRYSPAGQRERGGKRTERGAGVPRKSSACLTGNGPATPVMTLLEIGL